MAGSSPRRMHPLAGPTALILVLLIAAPGLTRGGNSGGSNRQQQQQQGECPNKHAADEDQGRGANDPEDHAYETTCDGRPSQNGQGGGNANGRPCQGCVGNADNKNPPGQEDDPPGDPPPSSNRGYECDTTGDPPNQGVAEGNPAHSTCEEYPIQ
jgi:hypothetical protein